MFRYHRGTSQYGLCYRWIEGVKLICFIDVNWVGIPSDRKRTSRGIFSIVSATISWYSRKQRSIALILVEVEYIVAR